MKRFLALLIALALLSSAALTKNSKGFSAMSCLTSNPLRDSYKRHGIEIFRRSVQETNYCVGEWDLKGTCCNVDQVSKYTTKKIEDNDRSLKVILTELETISPELEKFIQSYLGENSQSTPTAQPVVEQAPQTDSESQQQPEVAQPEAAQSEAAQPEAESEQPADPRTLQWRQRTSYTGTEAQRSAEMVDLKVQLLKVISNLKQNKDTLVAQQTKCMAKINIIVGVSPCSICSGNSAQYFKNGLLKMEERVCRDVLADCHPAWAHLVDISKKVQMFSDLASKLVGADLDDPSDSTSPKMGHAIMSYAKKTDIWAELAACEDPDNCPFRNAADLCERFISLDKANYAQKLGSEIRSRIAANGKKLRRKMSKFAKKFKAKLKQLKKLKSLAKKLSKLFKGSIKDLKKLKILQKISKILKKIRWMNKKFKKVLRSFSKTGKVCKKFQAKLKLYKSKLKRMVTKAKQTVLKARKYSKTAMQKLSTSKNLSQAQKAKLQKSLKNSRCAGKTSIKTKHSIKVKVSSQAPRTSFKAASFSFRAHSSIHRTKQSASVHRVSVSLQRQVAGVTMARTVSHQQSWRSTSVSPSQSRSSSSSQRSSSSRSSGKGRKLQTLLASGSSTGSSEVGVIPNKSCNPCAPFNGMDGP